MYDKWIGDIGCCIGISFLSEFHKAMLPLCMTIEIWEIICSFGLYTLNLFAILSSGTLLSSSPNSTFTLIALSFFVGRQDHRLHMIIVVQTELHIFLFLVCFLFQHFYRVQIIFFYITDRSCFILFIFICCLFNSLLMRNTAIAL